MWPTLINPRCINFSKVENAESTSAIEGGPGLVGGFALIPRRINTHTKATSSLSPSINSSISPGANPGPSTRPVSRISNCAVDTPSTLPAYGASLNPLVRGDEDKHVGVAQERGNTPAEANRSFWRTLGHLARQPWIFGLELVVIVVLGSILAVMIGNRYGSIWGGVVGIVVVPLVAVRFIRRKSSS
jgi:hypothetical protein